MWTINGTLKFNGSFKFLNGGYMCISKTGNLELGGNGLIGSDYKIMCFDSILKQPITSRYMTLHIITLSKKMDG